jgi:hypothetical protein
MKTFFCWLLTHRWKLVNRRCGMDLDHVDYQCTRCGAEEGGADGLLHLTKRPQLF